MSEVVTIKKDAYLMREGEESADMYYLQSGTLGIFKIKGNVEQQIGTIYSGEVVGEMSFLDKEPRSASVKAISDCTLTQIPVEKFERTLTTLPAWYKALVNTLLDRLRKANSRIRI
jgi:CRP/FNR family transcriptional regulator, cyclic AMP receptor protein